MSPVDNPILQTREECGASGGDLGYFPLALSFQNGFEMIRHVVCWTVHRQMTQMS